MKFFRNVFAFSLIPAIIVAGYTLIKKFLYLTIYIENHYLMFWMGVFFYVTLQFIFHKPIRAYVLGHELSHAIVGILSGSKIKKFDVKQKYGSVILTKNTVWITLAPYLFPIYTLVITITYIFLNWFIGIKKFYGYFMCLVGFSIAFHVTLTIHTLFTKQSDLKIYGVFSSYILILALNIVIFTLLIGVIFPEKMNMKTFFFQVLGNIEITYEIIYSGALLIWQTFQKTK
ncbi:MAG: hypothetical protein LBS78_00640 [Endomicrobium sp.]|jgi:hypothetical protein|nr:hypothetical protein [Endomicrobium sp.]